MAAREQGLGTHRAFFAIIIVLGTNKTSHFLKGAVAKWKSPAGSFMMDLKKRLVSHCEKALGPTMTDPSRIQVQQCYTYILEDNVLLNHKLMGLKTKLYISFGSFRFDMLSYRCLLLLGVMLFKCLV